MSTNDLRGMRKLHKIKITKGIGLLCLLFMISMVAMACNKSTKDSTGENDKIEDTNNQSTDSPTTETMPTKDTEPTEEPTPTKEPELTAEPTPTKEPELTAEPTPTKEPEPTAEPTPIKDSTLTSEAASMIDFIPSEVAIHSRTAFIQGNYLFYKTGKLTETVIATKNLKTSKITEITTIDEIQFNSSEFYLKGSNIYYHAEGDIYRIGVDGTNKSRLYKGTATILGIYDDDIFALDKKTKEIIRINKKGEKKTLVKLKSINTLEAVMMKDGIYYINKAVNNTFNGNDPIDRLYYIDYDGKNKTEVCSELDIYDLKTNGNELFFVAISEKLEEMRINKVISRMITTIHSFSKDEYEERGSQWYFASSFTLLGVNATDVYYGVDYNMVDDIYVYSVGTDGKNPGLYLDTKTIEGIDSSAYFSSGDVEGEYLKILFDCDTNPNELHLINIQDKTSIIFNRGEYLTSSIDIEGEYIYYCKAAKFDSYSEMPEVWEYGNSKISALK